jgi:uncharacterized protein
VFFGRPTNLVRSRDSRRTFRGGEFSVACALAFVHPRLARLPTRSLPGGLVVAEARSPPARALGLAWLRDLSREVGLLLVPCRSVHTVGMRFALDLVWLGAGGEVIRIDRAVTPGRLRTCRAARSVLETRAGAAAAFVAAGLPP